MHGKSQTKTVMVDDDDYERLSKYKWCASSSGDKYYAMRATRKGGTYKAIYMHRDVLPPPQLNQEVDHINRNTLDNRKSNLRIVSRRENAFNRYIAKKTAQRSKYKGVYWVDKMGKYVSVFNGTHIGCFEKEDDAALAYNAKAYEFDKNFVAFNIVPGVKKDKLTVMPKSYNKHQKSNKYRGVRRRSYRCWEAYIQYQGSQYVIGYANSELGAVNLYNAECDKLKLPKRKNKIACLSDQR